MIQSRRGIGSTKNGTDVVIRADMNDSSEKAYRMFAGKAKMRFRNLAANGEPLFAAS